MNEIVLLEYPRSSYAQKVRLLLRERNRPFISTTVDGAGSDAAFH
ncbi:hypothetical protein EZJ58_5311 [Sodalis ligni]|uniref:GST N-terminal domain-containing protein n=1 Tax=Sodalis ligni TaxID=2697027 RepID=A0A4V2Q3J2_9GAMM|nr:hypothetical protein EZJ58_5311 [Sodalis ligni]